MKTQLLGHWIAVGTKTGSQAPVGAPPIVPPPACGGRPGGGRSQVGTLAGAHRVKGVIARTMAVGLIVVGCLGIGTALAAEPGMAIDPAAVLKAVPPKAAGAVSEKKGTATDKAGSLPKKHPPKAPDGTRSLPQRLPFGGNTGVSPPAPGVTADKSLAPAVGLPSKLPTKAFGSAVERGKRNRQARSSGCRNCRPAAPRRSRETGQTPPRPCPRARRSFPACPRRVWPETKGPSPQGLGTGFRPVLGRAVASCPRCRGRRRPR